MQSRDNEKQCYDVCDDMGSSDPVPEPEPVDGESDSLESVLAIEAGGLGDMAAIEGRLGIIGRRAGLISVGAAGRAAGAGLAPAETSLDTTTAGTAGRANGSFFATGASPVGD